jgi:hypothetical protein
MFRSRIEAGQNVDEICEQALEAPRDCPMNSSLAFIPRNAALKRKKPAAQPGHAQPINTSSGSTAKSANEPGSSSKTDDSKNTEGKFSETDASVLLTIAFSNYSIWCNPNLRMQIERSSSGCMCSLCLSLTSKLSCSSRHFPP